MSTQARRSGGVLPALVLAVLAFSLVQTSVVPILPTLQHQLRVTGSAITWLMTANLLSAAVLTPLLARVGDLRGRKPVLLIAIAGVLAGGVLGGLTSSFPLLVVARVIAGTGGAILPLAVAVVRDELPREKVTGAVALISASLGVGSGLGLVATGAIVEHFDYKAVFWMGAALSAVAVLLVAALVPHDPVHAEGKADPLGAVLLAGWLSSFLIAVSQGNAWGWTSARTLGLFVAAAVLLAVWVAVERRMSSPLVDICDAGQARGRHDQRRGAAHRVRDVRVLPADVRLHADPQGGRLRLRRHRARVGLDAVPVGGRVVPGRAGRRRPDPPRRPAPAAGARRGLRRGGAGPAGVRALLDARRRDRLGGHGRRRRAWRTRRCPPTSTGRCRWSSPASPTG